MTRGIEFPDYRRVTTARDKKTKGLVPAMQNPAENANQVLERQVITLNRAGTDPGNPVLGGLGFHVTLPIGIGQTLTGLFVFTDPKDGHGSNLASQATVEAPGVAGYEFLVGSGQSKAGSPETGAVRNFLRAQTKKGGWERQFYAKTMDNDIVTLNGEAALDPETMDPVEIVAEIVDGSRDWLDIRTDFFVSWNDAFQVLNQRNDADATAGFKKANGGALVVSFFDTDPGTEGVGVQVNPLNQVDINGRRTIQIENTEGLKEITARFRSKIDSSYFVDVPILIQVVDNAETCHPPLAEPCTELFLKAGDETREGLPSEASVPGVQVVAGPDETISTDLIIVTILGAMVGGTPILRVRKLGWTPSAAAVAGARLVQIGDDEDYLPLVQDASIPVTAPPYGDPHRYTVAFSRLALVGEGVSILQCQLIDGEKPSMAVNVTGPVARSIQFMPEGGLGGGPECAGY